MQHLLCIAVDLATETQLKNTFFVSDLKHFKHQFLVGNLRHRLTACNDTRSNDYKIDEKICAAKLQEIKIYVLQIFIGRCLLKKPKQNVNKNKDAPKCQIILSVRFRLSLTFSIVIQSS